MDEVVVFLTGVMLGVLVIAVVAIIAESPVEERSVCVEYSVQTGECVQEMIVADLIEERGGE